MRHAHQVEEDVGREWHREILDEFAAALVREFGDELLAGLPDRLSRLLTALGVKKD